MYKNFTSINSNLLKNIYFYIFIYSFPIEKKYIDLYITSIVSLHHYSRLSLDRLLHKKKV